jgi:predicted Zn-dependent protease
MSNKTRCLAATLLALAVTSCVTSPTGRRQLSLVSEEAAIGASAEAYTAQLAEFRREGKIEDDGRVTRRIDQITERLVAQAIAMRPETASWEWSVAVIDDPEMINAWCMAGGRMAVYTGLLTKLDPSDDELAQVLAHEISHALANHTAERMSVALATSAGVALAGAVADDNREGVQTAAAVAAQLAVQLPNSRSAESEADEIGIELAAKAGYNPNAAVTLWRKMQEAGGSGPPQFLSTHPNPANRQERLAALAPQMMAYYNEARGDAPSHPVAGAVAAR